MGVAFAGDTKGTSLSTDNDRVKGIAVIGVEIEFGGKAS